MRTSTPSAFALTAAISASLGLAACGASSQPDPLASFKTQTLAWAPCDPTIAGPGFAERLARLGSRATCALLRAPIDYASPSGGEFKIALLRVAAGDASRRRGAILLNPGGPGDDGLFLAPLVGSIWAEASSTDPVGALYAELSRVYDLVGFSPRGTGASTELTCNSSEQLSFVANEALDRSPANVDAMLRNARLLAESCRKNPLTPFVHTDATARDMDLLREVLGDARLSYFGLSYGTWLGAWYAGLFPDRVDRMVLSGVLDLTKSLSNLFVLQAAGIQYVMDELHSPYAALHPDTYLLGSTADAVRGVYAGLRQEVKQALNPHLVALMGTESARDDVLFLLLAARTLDGILSATPPPADEYAAYGRVEAAVAFVPDDGRRSKVHDDVNQLIPAYFALSRKESGKVELTGKSATLWSVICNDTPWGFDVPSWVHLQDQLSALYPIQGGLFTGSPCLYWGGPTVTRPPLANLNRAGPILLTQTQFDPQTPLSGARASFLAIPTSSLIQIDGGWNHGVMMPSGNPCVDVPVARYLLDGTVPASRETHCANLDVVQRRGSGTGPGSSPLESRPASFRSRSSCRRKTCARGPPSGRIGCALVRRWLAVH
ncbi:MAG: alpha/beta fold hydrolase [Deltaproteobacteria bacterium]